MLMNQGFHITCQGRSNAAKTVKGGEAPGIGWAAMLTAPPPTASRVSFAMLFLV